MAILYEFCKSLTDRGNYFPPSQVGDFIKPMTEGYRSYFGYDENMIRYIASGKQIKPGINGKFYINQIVLDVDRKEDSYKELSEKVFRLADRLVSEFDLEDNFQLWFSGRGFHFHIPNIFGFIPSNRLPEIVHDTLLRHFPETDLMPVNKRGLIRLGGTCNLKTSLYKIPISDDEVWKIQGLENQVTKWASDNRQIEKAKMEGWKTFPELIVFPKEEQSQERSIRGPAHTDEEANRFVTCMQTAYTNGAVKGERHQMLLRIIAWLRRRGVPQDGVVAMVMHWMNGEGGAKEVQMVNQSFIRKYEYGCDDEYMQKFCSSKCVHYKRRSFLTEIISAGDLEEEYAKHIRSDWKKGSIDLGKILGLDHEEWFVQPQDVVGIIGGTGLNKTALAQNMAIAMLEFAPLLYISTEFSNQLLMRRFSQIAHNMSKDDIYEHYSTPNYEPLSTVFNHVKFVNATPTFDALEELIRKYKPRILMIDVIDDIIKTGKSGTEGESLVGQGIKDLGRKYNHFTFYVHHISKSAAYDEKGNPKRLTIHSGKGSSTIEQKSDIVLAIEGYQDENFRSIRTLKSRDNPPFQHGYNVDMGTFRFSRNMNANEIIYKEEKRNEQRMKQRGDI